MSRPPNIWRRSARISGKVAQAWSLFSRYVSDISSHVPGNELTLLRGGAETFPQMLAAIADATTSVHLETYIWEPDSVGQQFANALMEKSRSGVRVRVIFDGFGSSSLSFDFIEQLKDSRVEVLEYRPFRTIDRLQRFTRRDHRKILVVDGEVSFCGGINLTDNQLPSAVGGAGWRDTHLMMRGPISNQLEQLFHETWHREGATPYHLPPFAIGKRTGTDDGDIALALHSDDAGHRSAIRRHYLQAIESATESIYIANAYFAPDRAFVRALCKASARGVDVRLLLPSRAHNDILLVQLAAQHLYDKLLRTGVRIYQWPDAHMHAKTAVIDSVWSVVGSYNLDFVSLFLNLEVVIEVLGNRFGGEMLRMFQDDFDNAQEVFIDTWRERPRWQRIGEAIGYRMRRFL